jgi:hypothetical protein
MRPSYSLHKRRTLAKPPLLFYSLRKTHAANLPLIPSIAEGPSPNLPYYFIRKHDMKYSQNN